MNNSKWSEIKALDLSEIKKKVKEKHKAGWFRRKPDWDKVETEYRQFLFLIAENPTKTVVPWSEELDQFWHMHILDTRKYEADCQKVFGRYIHHNPHLDTGTTAQVTAFNETKQMYKTAFGTKAKSRTRSGVTTETSSAGCGTIMPVVFCASASCGSSSHSSSSHSTGSSCGSSSSSSCGSSSCGGGGCGGGGGD